MFSTAFTVIVCDLNLSVARCTAPATELDAKAGTVGCRSQVHTDILVEHYSHKVVWEDYGIMGNLIVSDIISFEGQIS